MVSRDELYYIVPISNITSIVEGGILCHNLAKKILHQSVALTEVQERRECKKVPNAGYLHDYVNLYFNPRNPMMYKRRDMFMQICVLSIQREVLYLPGVLVSDMNASKDLCKFLEPKEAIQSLDFEKIYVRNWNIPDHYDILKGATCAEVLVPSEVPYRYVVKAYIAHHTLDKTLREYGFSKPIICDADLFFR